MSRIYIKIYARIFTGTNESFVPTAAHIHLRLCLAVHDNQNGCDETLCFGAANAEGI